MLKILSQDVKAALVAYRNCLDQQCAICGSSLEVNMLRAGLAREAGEIWRDGIGEAFRGGWNPAISGANKVDANLGTLSGTLVVQRSLELLPYNFPFLKAVTSDFTAERSAMDQEITTRIVSIPSVSTYSTTTGWADVTVTATDVHVTVNKHIGVPLTYNANQVQGTIRNLFDELAPAASAALAADMMASLYALITAGNFPSAAVVCDLATFGRAAEIDLSTALTKRRVPMGPDNRTLLLSTDFFGALSKDPTIVTVANGAASGDKEAGVLPDVGGMKVVCSPTLPSTGNLCGFAFSKSALVIATHLAGDYTKALPQANYGNAYIVTDPQLGISVQVVEYVGHTAGTTTRRLSLMSGVAVGNPDTGQILTSK